jgi:hypothetical protein
VSWHFFRLTLHYQILELHLYNASAVNSYTTVSRLVSLGRKHFFFSCKLISHRIGSWTPSSKEEKIHNPACETWVIISLSQLNLVLIFVWYFESCQKAFVKQCGEICLRILWCVKKISVFLILKTTRSQSYDRELQRQRCKNLKLHE